jgi:hypothetical protein
MGSQKRRRLRLLLLPYQNLQRPAARLEGATGLQSLEMAAQLRMVMHECHLLSFCCKRTPAFAPLLFLFGDLCSLVMHLDLLMNVRCDFCFASYVLLKFSDAPTLFDHQHGLDEENGMWMWMCKII